MGKIRVVITFNNGMTEVHEVNPIVGYDYHGEYFVVHEVDGDITTDYPYCLRDIRTIEKGVVETIH